MAYKNCRAVGLTSAQVSRIFLYESFAVILSALILGFIVGILVSVTLTLQLNAFVEMPFKFTVIMSVKIVSCDADVRDDCFDLCNDLCFGLLAF